MTKTYDSNNVFWGTDFRRISNEYLDTFEIDKGMKWQNTSSLNGCWEGDDKSIYIIGTHNNQINWLGIDKNNKWSHVTGAPGIMSLSVFSQYLVHFSSDLTFLFFNRFLV